MLIYLPFAGDTYVTVSYVLPCILSLHTHLREMKTKTKFCGPLVDALQSSLHKRFAGIFIRSGIAKSSVSDPEPPFSDDIYFLSTVLNPTFGIRWIECDICNDDIPTVAAAASATNEEREILATQFRDTLRKSVHGRHAKSIVLSITTTNKHPTGYC